MRALSFLFALIAIILIGSWYWLAHQSVASTSPSSPPPPATTDAEMKAVIVEELEVKGASAAESANEAMPEMEADDTDRMASPNFSAQSVGSREEVAPPPPPVTVPATSELDNFKSRPIAYNRPPEVLVLGQPIDVSLIIDATSKAAPATGLEGFEGEIVERNVSLSDEVSAQLTGSAFDIQLMSVERQRLSPRAQNRWQWRITPIKEGEHTLILEIFGYANGSSAAEPLDAYRDRISVKVKQLDRIITLAQAYEPVIGIAGGIAGVFSALFAFVRIATARKKKR